MFRRAKFEKFLFDQVSVHIHFLGLFQEVICGKCTVVCSSKDIRNRQPSESDIKNADFFFSQIYDVDLNQFRPIDEVVDKLGCHGEV